MVRYLDLLFWGTAMAVAQEPNVSRKLSTSEAEPPSVKPKVDQMTLGGPANH